ncbi:hypothetical protein BRPE67_BCDS03190 [Caballeronia cordobensis]|nr:hypothetical protein BRPE67_BCDS03190 [Burkholderia sp. RPE67]
MSLPLAGGITQKAERRGGGKMKAADALRIIFQK